jgi:hypothetical protein
MVKAITYILENDETVQELVGARVGGDAESHKIYPVVVPQSEKFPYIAVSQFSKVGAGKNCGYNYGIRVSVYDNSYDGVSEISDAVLAAVASEASGEVNGFDVSFANVSNEQDGYDKDHGLYVKIIDFEGLANPVS